MIGYGLLRALRSAAARLEYKWYSPWPYYRWLWRHLLRQSNKAAVGRQREFLADASAVQFAQMRVPTR